MFIINSNFNRNSAFISYIFVNYTQTFQVEFRLKRVSDRDIYSFPKKIYLILYIKE